MEVKTNKKKFEDVDSVEEFLDVLANKNPLSQLFTVTILFITFLIVSTIILVAGLGMFIVLLMIVVYNSIVGIYKWADRLFNTPRANEYVGRG